MTTGRLLGSRYLLIAPLGSGAWGQVWRAADQELERMVAIKLVRDIAAADRPRFVREARALSRLNHRNVVAAYDFGIDGADAYLVMELVAGPTLFAELAAARAAGRPGLEADRVFDIADQVLAGLTAMHAAKIVHRDLKPDNVVATSDGAEIKIVDLGIARELDRTPLTTLDTVLGTMPYVSPEQLDGATLDGRTDLYSLGCMLHELLTGQYALIAGTTASWVQAHHTQTPARVRDICPEVSPALDAFVYRLLAKSPDGRPASAAAARAELTAARAGPARPIARAPVRPAPTLPITRPPAARRTARRWRVPAIAAVSALLSAALVAGLYAQSRPPATASSGPGGAPSTATPATTRPATTGTATVSRTPGTTPATAPQPIDTTPAPTAVATPSPTPPTTTAVHPADAWPVSAHDGSTAMYAYFGSEFFFPDWVSCERTFCIAGDASEVHLYTEHPLDDIDQFSATVADPYQTLLRHHLSPAQAHALLDS